MSTAPYGNDEPYRSGQLADYPAVRIRAFINGCVVYWGTTRDLMRAGCLNHSMVARRAVYRKGDTRKLRDKHGTNFTLQRAATKSSPGRMLLTFWRMDVDRPRAMDLPGMRDLFPDGHRAIPEAPRMRNDIENERVREACRLELNMFQGLKHYVLRVAREQTQENVWSADEAARINQFCAQTQSSFEQLVRSIAGAESQPAPVRHLRLVVNNTHREIAP